MYMSDISGSCGSDCYQCLTSGNEPNLSQTTAKDKVWMASGCHVF